MINSSDKNFFLTKDISVHSDIALRDRFNLLLLRKGMSQNQLANKIGIAIGTMSKIANGDWTPTSQIKIRISEILEVDSLVIFGAKEYWAEWRNKIGYPKKVDKVDSLKEESK